MIKNMPSLPKYRLYLSLSTGQLFARLWGERGQSYVEGQKQEQTIPKKSNEEQKIKAGGFGLQLFYSNSA